MLAATVVSVVLHTMRTDTLRALGSALMSAEAQAVRDPLSGLLNRRGLAVVGEEVLALAKHPILIDGRNLYDPAKMRELGFTYKSVGRH